MSIWPLRVKTAENLDRWMMKMKPKGEMLYIVSKFGRSWELIYPPEF